MDSILTSIKKLLGIEEEDTSFDQDIIMDINSAFMILYQLGVNPTTCFSISDKTKKWSDFLETRVDLEMVKTYVYLKTRIIFDPPATSFAIEAMERQTREMEWRLNVQAEDTSGEGEV